MMRFGQWLNGTSMTSFRAFVLSIVGSVILLWFSSISGKLLLDSQAATAALNKDPGIRAAAQGTESSHHNYGMQLATLVIGAVVGALGINALSQHSDRKTSREFMEAKEKGQISGVAAAAAAAQLVANPVNGNITKERAAVVVTSGKDVTTDVHVEGGE